MKTDKIKLDEIIRIEKSDNFLGHLSSVIFEKNKIVAEKNESVYKVWVSHKFANIIYPIYNFEFDTNDNICKLSTKTNIIGKALIGVYFFFAFLFLANILIKGIFVNKKIITMIPFTVMFLLLFCFYLVINKIYKTEKKYFINELKVLLKINTKEELEKIELSKNEWTYFKILIRVFMYSFILGLLILSIFGIINGHVKTALGIPICLAYLYSDIKIIREKNKL